MLLREHEAGRPRRSTGCARSPTGYRAPAGADDGHRGELYAALGDYDRALVRHMHVEGNALFPRARKLEEKLRAGQTRPRGPWGR
jgi:iron-sulfur cluster repair protein YtfE (RIC family)